MSSEDNNAQKKIPTEKKAEETTNRNPQDVDDSNIIVISPSDTGSKAYEADQPPSGGVESVSTKAKEAGLSLRELVLAFGRKAKAATESTSKELKSKATDVTTPDAKDVQTLGANVDTIIAVFEDTMDEIHKEDYDEQEKLLAGYKKYLESQVKVVDTRLNLAKRLKRGA